MGTFLSRYPLLIPCRWPLALEQADTNSQRPQQRRVTCLNRASALAEAVVLSSGRIYVFWLSTQCGQGAVGENLFFPIRWHCPPRRTRTSKRGPTYTYLGNHKRTPRLNLLGRRAVAIDKGQRTQLPLRHTACKWGRDCPWSVTLRIITLERTRYIFPRRHRHQRNRGMF